MVFYRRRNYRKPYSSSFRRRRTYQRRGFKPYYRNRTSMIPYKMNFPSQRVATTGTSRVGFPKFMYAKLKTIHVAHIIGGESYYNLKLKVNSCNDPFMATGDQKPVHYEHFCASDGPYTLYKVLSGYLDLEFVNKTGDSFMVVWYLAVSTTQPLNYDSPAEWLSQDGAKHRIVLGTGDGSSERYTKIRIPFNIKKGVMYPQVSTVDNLFGAYNGDPATTYYIHIGLFSRDENGTGDNITANFTAILHQNVMFCLNQVDAAVGTEENEYGSVGLKAESLTTSSSAKESEVKVKEKINPKLLGKVYKAGNVVLYGSPKKIAEAKVQHEKQKLLESMNIKSQVVSAKNVTEEQKSNKSDQHEI